MAGNGQNACSLIKRVKSFGRYVALVSQMPWLHKVFQGNFLLRKMKPSHFMKVVQGTVNERLDDAKMDPEARSDLLSHFIASHGTNTLMDRKQVLIMSSGNLIAGGLSPGTTFDCLCRSLATYPEMQDQVHAELVQARCTIPALFDDVKDLPYLEGVIREAHRLQGNASFNLQRVTGITDLDLPNGWHITAGTQIGCSPGALNKDFRIWGADADVYRPERWARGSNESPEAHQERRKMLDRINLTFGQGSRTCIGKSITALEIFKVVATLMMNFRVISPLLSRILKLLMFGGVRTSWRSKEVRGICARASTRETRHATVGVLPNTSDMGECHVTLTKLPDIRSLKRTSVRL